MTFAFSLGNVTRLCLDLGITVWIAWLVGPMVDLSVVGLLTGIRLLSQYGYATDQLAGLPLAWRQSSAVKRERKAAHVPLQSCGLALLTVTSLAVTLTACSSGSSHQAAAPASSPAASASAPASSAPSSAALAAAPAGYKRVGGVSQGISLAVPSSWADLDLSKELAAKAVSKLKLSSAAATQLTSSLSQLQQSKAIVAADLKYAATAHDHFTRNINAYCTPTDVTDTGAAAVPVIKSAVQSQLGTIATDITEQDTVVGGVPGVETSYKFKSGAIGVFYGSQLEVAPKADTACFVTLTALEPEQGSKILAEAAKTAQFP